MPEGKAGAVWHVEHKIVEGRRLTVGPWGSLLQYYTFHQDVTSEKEKGRYPEEPDQGRSHWTTFATHHTIA